MLEQERSTVPEPPNKYFSGARKSPTNFFPWGSAFAFPFSIGYWLLAIGYWLLAIGYCGQLGYWALVNRSYRLPSGPAHDQLIGLQLTINDFVVSI
jgi:hypothetical protein